MSRAQGQVSAVEKRKQAGLARNLEVWALRELDDRPQRRAVGDGLLVVIAQREVVQGRGLLRGVLRPRRCKFVTKVCVTELYESTSEY